MNTLCMSFSPGSVIANALKLRKARLCFKLCFKLSLDSALLGVTMLIGMKKTAKKIICTISILIFPLCLSWAGPNWEKQGDFYYLTKNTRDFFSAPAAGANKFSSKYLTCDGVGFLVRGVNDWNDYGRLNLDGNNIFSFPLRPGMKVEEVHFLSGGNFGNSYEHDRLLSLYGDKYFYAVVSVIFAYQDGQYQSLSVPVFWDWFHLGPGEWSKGGAKIKYLGNNPVRRDCSIYHLTFVNPRPQEPVKDILVTDSWLGDRPYSDIFSVTLKSSDSMDASPKEERKFEALLKDVSQETADTRTSWEFESGLDGWIAGCSNNWDSAPFWQKDSYGRQGVVIIPACNWGQDKSAWIEKKVTLPDRDKLKIQFLRHSAVFSTRDNQWSDGLLKIIVKAADKQDTVYEKLYSGEWSLESADLSRYKGKTVIIRFENFGAGTVRLSPSSSAACDGEDAVIDSIRVE